MDGTEEGPPASGAAPQNPGTDPALGTSPTPTPTSAPTPPSPPNSSTEPVIRDPQKLLSAHETVKQENAELKAQLKETQDKLRLIEQSLGNLSETTAREIRQQLEEAQRVKAEKDQLIAEAVLAEQQKYLPQIQQLEQSNLTLTQTLESFQCNQALSSAFGANNGGNFAEFAALLPVAGLTPEYIEVNDPISPTGKSKKLKRITQVDGSAITDKQGKELIPSEIFREMNTGRFGSAIKATFQEYNQSNGDGFFHGESNGSPQENPWSKTHWNLTKQGQLVKNNRALARQMASSEGYSIPN